MTKPNTNKEDSTSGQERPCERTFVGAYTARIKNGISYCVRCNHPIRDHKTTLTDNTKDTNPPEPKTSESYYLPKDRQRKLANLKDNTKAAHQKAAAERGKR